jgi:4-amino-4-deoxy-L-arabinose transferase-like glycosyltransferase
MTLVRDARGGTRPVSSAPLIAGVALAACWFLGFAHALFFKYPPLWPDEALFADPAINLLHHGVLGTDVLSGILPGASRCTFLQPPLYYFFLWFVFSLAGVSALSLRFASLILGLAAAALTYFLGSRSGLGRWAALSPVMLLFLDTTFLRGSLIGRMDMLALVFILLALVLDVGTWPPAAGAEGRKKMFLTGCVCSLAALAHPMGAVAPAAVGLRRVAFPEAPRWRILPPLASGILAPLALWVAYIVPHWKDFTVQFGGQVLTKAGRNPLALHQMIHTFRTFLEQYGKPGDPVLGVVWLAGLTGLFLAARRRRALLVLPACQLAIMGVAIWGGEIWYVLYLAPLTAIGLMHLVWLAAEPGIWRKSAGWLAVLLALWFAQKNVLRTYLVNYDVNISNRGETDYSWFCRQVSLSLPPNSTVLLSVTPDPYFCLKERPDLILREFLPKGFPVDPSKYRQWVLDSDYVVIRSPDPSSEVWGLVRAKGKLVARIGVPLEHCYYAEIYKFPK